MSQRPKWVEDLRMFITDDLLDESHGFPMEGQDDDLHDEITAAVLDILCERYGHEIIDDQCGNPDHRYCVYCLRNVGQINATSADQQAPTGSPVDDGT